jgi:hypothetical protein
MQMLKEIMATFTPYRGSLATASRTKAEIEKRWGPQAASEYLPEHNCRTYAEWRKIGYKVKPGEKAIKSVTVIEEKDEKGNVIKTYPLTVNLFYVSQVSRVV